MTNASEALSETYAYDENSNPTSITDESGQQSTFTYDDLDRITQEEHPQKGATSYAYDPAGNRTSMTEGSTTSSYAYDAAERMLSAGSTTFSHDRNGNRTSRTEGLITTNYSYDFEDGMTRAGNVTYQRDSFGRVVSSRAGGASRIEWIFGDMPSRRRSGGTLPPTITPGGRGQDRLEEVVDVSGEVLPLQRYRRRYGAHGRGQRATLEAGMWLAGTFYNFRQVHKRLRRERTEWDPSGGRWVESTPAQPVGLSDHRWSVEELLSFSVPPVEIPKWRGRRSSRLVKAARAA